MAADRSIQALALAMSKPAVAIEDKKESTPLSSVFKDEVQKYYPNRESVLCPEYGYAIAHARRKITDYLLILLHKHCPDLMSTCSNSKFLIFASTYYSFNRNLKMMIDDGSSFIHPDSTAVKSIFDFLSSTEENIYRSILESVIDIIRKRYSVLVKPSTGLLSHIPDAPLMQLFNFVESYILAISNGIFAQCPEIYTLDTLEEIIFEAQKKYYGVPFLLLGKMQLKQWLDDAHADLALNNKTSLLELKLTSLDSEASAVLDQYNKGVCVSATPLWDPWDQKLLKEEIEGFLMPDEEIIIDVNVLASGSPFDTTLKNETFLIFKGEDDTLSFTFESINALLPTSVKMEMDFEDVIGIGFRFTEDIDLEALRNLSIQTMSLALNRDVPAFFYHPYLGLKHIPATRLLDMLNKVASISPVMDFAKAMQNHHIIWQKPQMGIYEALHVASCNFSFETIRNEDKANYAGEESELYAEDERIPFSFSFRHSSTSSFLSGKTEWFENIIPVLHLNSKLYLDRDNKITTLLNKRKQFYLLKTFTCHYEEFKKTLSRLTFLLKYEFNITNLSLTPYSSQNSMSIHCNFRSTKKRNVKLFNIRCKNNSILDSQNIYLLVRRLEHYLEKRTALHAPAQLLSPWWPKISIESLAVSLSLHDFTKEDIVPIFDRFKSSLQGSFDRKNKKLLNLFLDTYLNHYTAIPPACKAEALLSILQLLHLELSEDKITLCLLWFVAHDRLNELNQLALPTVMTLRSYLLRATPPSAEVTAALLTLERITPSTKPFLPQVESKRSIPIAPQNAPLVVLPIPKPLEITIESKREEKKEELKKILWQEKEINQDTPLAVVVQYALDQYYLKPYPEQPAQLINRPLHGGTHAIMAVLLVDLFKELFKKYYPDFLVDPLTQKNRLSAEEEKLVYLMVLYHDSGNTKENQNANTDQSVHADHFFRDAIRMGFSIKAAEKCRILMIHKDNTANQNIEKVILHDADCLEFLRCCPKERYDLTRLNIYHLIKNNCPGALPAFEEEIKNIIDYYKLFLTLIYDINVHKKFESKDRNLRDHLYTKMKEEIIHYRLMRAIYPNKPQFLVSSLCSVHKTRVLHKLGSSLSLISFYSYQKSDDEKINEVYFNEPPETIAYPSFSLGDIKALGSREAFEGPFILRGLQKEFSEEATVWDQNLAILREEKISNLLALKKRYATEPLEKFRFRPATLILPNVSVKSRWGSYLHILLKPSAVAFWGGFKKNVFSNFFEAKDFDFKDALPKRTIKGSTTTAIAPKVKTFQTIEPFLTKLQEMEAVRRGQKLSHQYRYFGCSALPPNEVFIMNQDSLSASIEAVGICCDLTSPTWHVDVASVAQEILILSVTLPPKIRYFFYLPEKGLVPLSLAEINLIAKGRIQSDLKDLGHVEGVNLFAPRFINFNQVVKEGITLESKAGDFENQKFKFNLTSSEGVGPVTTFMRGGLPFIQKGSNIYFDAGGAFRVLARKYSQFNLSSVQKLLLRLYWEMLSLFQVIDVEMNPLLDHETQDKDIIQLSFRFLGLVSGIKTAQSLLTWMGYPVAEDKLRILYFAEGRMKLILSYPQTLNHVQQTLTQHEETSQRELCLEEKAIETFTLWNQLSTKHKNLLNFCKLLAIELKNPSREEAIFSAINDILPSFKDIPLGLLTGMIQLFNKCILNRWTEDQRGKLMAQFLFVLHAHCPLSLKRALQVIETDISDHFLFTLFSSKRLAEVKLIDSAPSAALQKVHRIITQGKDYVVESAMTLIVKYVDYFSLDQLTQMLWTFIWEKQIDIKLIGREGLFKIEKRFSEKKDSSSLSLHVMHSLLCGKQRELETLREEKPHPPLDSVSSTPLPPSRKRKEREVKEENDPKHPRSPTGSSSTAPP